MTVQSFIITGFVYNVSPDSCPSKEELFTGKLKMDTAFVNITSTLNYSINVEGISSDCYEVCLLDLKLVLHDNMNRTTTESSTTFHQNNYVSFHVVQLRVEWTWWAIFVFSVLNWN